LLNTIKYLKTIQSRFLSGNKTLFILFILISNFGLGQNLIPNPSFEVYDTCPTTISSVGDYQINHCTGWTAPSLATSDYFNACSPLANVPNAVFSYQYALDGVGMLGMLMEIDSGEIPYFEYVQAKLSKPLIQGYSYKFSFNVNLANGSDYAVKKIGAWFTTNAVSSNDGLPLFSVNPQIENTTGFITDTLGWTKIEGEFIADGGEEYITIGYYSDTLNVDTLRNNPSAISSVIFVYYYIDGLELEEEEQAILIPNIITPNNDGTNDIFQLNFQYESIVIYNRWGQQLFESNNNEAHWSGRTTSGNEVPDGTYYYLITTKKETFKGFVQVIR
jgi:gliding motility-associated-like protein